MRHNVQCLMSALALAASVSLWTAPGAAALAPAGEAGVYYDDYGAAFYEVDGEDFTTLLPEEGEMPVSDEAMLDAEEPDDEEESTEETEEVPLPEEPSGSEEANEKETPEEPVLDDPDSSEGNATLEETIEVQVSWGNMTFTYEEGNWDADTLTYDDSGWENANSDSGNNKIEIRNTGTKTVTVKVAFQSDIEWLTAEFENDSGTKMPDNKSKFSKELTGDGTKETYYLKLYGKPTEALNGVTIGTITVSLSDVAEENIP